MKLCFLRVIAAALARPEVRLINLDSSSSPRWAPEVAAASVE